MSTWRALFARLRAIHAGAVSEVITNLPACSLWVLSVLKPEISSVILFD